MPQDVAFSKQVLVQGWAYEFRHRGSRFANYVAHFCANYLAHRLRVECESTWGRHSSAGMGRAGRCAPKRRCRARRENAHEPFSRVGNCPVTDATDSLSSAPTAERSFRKLYLTPL
jgi:hypothetical protein